MKITCTKSEKIQIIEALMNDQFCPRPNDNESCIYDSGCYDCIDETIEWEVEDKMKPLAEN